MDSERDMGAKSLACTPETDRVQSDFTRLKGELGERIIERIEHYARWSKFWTTVYHVFLYLSIMLSAAVALIVKLESLKHATVVGLTQSDMAAILSGIAAVCSTLIAGGGFNRKWRANLVARRESEQLAIDLNTVRGLDNLNAIGAQLKQIIKKQNEGILGPP
jgi:hypothetical protein